MMKLMKRKEMMELYKRKMMKDKKGDQEEAWIKKDRGGVGLSVRDLRAFVFPGRVSV